MDTTISADFVSLTFVIDVIVFDFTVVFVIDVIADITFDTEFNVIIAFVVADVTAIMIDNHLLAVVDVINVIVVAIFFFVVNDMIVDTGHYHQYLK